LPSSQIVHVIDDDAAVRQSLAFLLKMAGLTVRVHDSATTFLEMLPLARAGCIVTDVRMPEIDGLELQRRLRARKIGIPVIVITGHGDVALAVEAMKAGAADFIEKPFDDEVPSARLWHAVHGIQATRHGSPRSAGTSSSCRRASAKCSTDWSRASPTRSLPMSLASAPARSRSTAPR
jgi:two-component system response regulator FixJ